MPAETDLADRPGQGTLAAPPRVVPHLVGPAMPAETDLSDGPGQSTPGRFNRTYGTLPLPHRSAIGSASCPRS